MSRLIKPVMEIKKRKLSTLSPDSQRVVCTCEEPCEYHITLDGFGRYCEKQALRIAHHIISLVHDLNIIESTNTRYGWTIKEEQFIQDWYRNKERIERGDLRIIASMLNRPYPRTKAKIDRMRREGKI